MAIERLLLDTNILLDVVDAKRLGHTAAVELLCFVTARDDIEVLATISSFKDTYYILNRLYRDERKARDATSDLMRAIIAVDLLGAYGKEAIASDELDFEDALIRVTAEHEDASAIITRDGSAFVNSSIPHFSSAEYLEIRR